MTYAFEATGLVKRFGSTLALDGVDLAARQGTVLGVLGPNGAGKTTAVRILATLLRPDGGHATVGGLDVVKDAALVRREIGLTGQYASVDETLTGTENLVLIGRLLDLPRGDAKARARELLAQFDLDEAADRLAKTYSGGMRRRLDLAASLVGRPSVLYLDEPTTGLDPVKREDVWAMVRDLAADGVTVLLTTQYLDEADALADEISVIGHGRVIAHGTPAELKQIVGGQSITVRPADPSQVDAVAAILSTVSGRPATSPGRGVVTVPVASAEPFADVVRRLAEAGITARSCLCTCPASTRSSSLSPAPPTPPTVPAAPTNHPARTRPTALTRKRWPPDDHPRSGARAPRCRPAARPRPAQPFAGLAHPAQDQAHAGTAARRDAAAAHLHHSVRLRLRWCDRRNAARLPAIRVAVVDGADGDLRARSPSAPISTTTSRTASSTASGACRSRDPRHWSALCSAT